MNRVFLLHPATFALDGGAMFGIIPKPLWERKIKPDEYNRIPMALRVMLIQTPSKNILIDTGIGEYHADKFKDQFDIRQISDKSPLIHCINQVGLEADDITDIILTHLHFDHIGGLGGRDNKIQFPNATLHLHSKHYEYAQNPSLRDAGSFQHQYFKPLIDQYTQMKQVQWLTGDDGVILKDEDNPIKFLTSFGHTPHMVHPIFDQFIYMADLVPMSHHVHVPWVMGYDIEPAVTTKYKQKFYETIMREELYMVFEHDLDIWGGQLAQDEKGKFLLKQPMPADRKASQELTF